MTEQWRDRAAREAQIREALTGVELDEYDERIVTWLAGWEPSTVGTVASWLHRVRDTPGNCDTPNGSESS